MNIFNTNQIENHHIFGLIVGASGSGKTSLAGTLDGESTLILSCENGLLSLQHKSIDVISIKTKQDIIDSYMFLKVNQHKYRHIFIDSITELGEIIFKELKPLYDKKQMFGLYDAYSTALVGLIKAFRDFQEINVWFTCLDKIEQKEYAVAITLDLIQKSLGKKIPAFFDEVFYLSAIKDEDGNSKRFLITDNSEHDFCKDRSGKLDKFEKPDLGLITTKILGELK